MTYKLRGLFQSTRMSTVKDGDSGDTENQSGLRDLSEAESTGLHRMDEQRKRECVGSMSNCVYVAPHTGGKQING